MISKMVSLKMPTRMDDELNKLSEVEERSKSNLIRIAIKKYITEKRENEKNRK